MNYIRPIIQNRGLQHLLFWILSFYVLLRIFAYEFPPQKVDYIYTFLFHFSIWAGVYFNLMILIPYFLKRANYLVYFFSFLLTLILMVMINIWTFKVLSDWLFPDYYFISYYNFGDLIQFSLVFLISTSLLKLSKAWFELNTKNKVIRELEEQKVKAELQALKHQLDPHFLFNSLNTIYSMTMEESTKAGEAVLQLSDNMRYILYKADAEEIELALELEFIENYIELQKARIGENTVDIQFEIAPDLNQATKVAPLLFLPFIENAFKHGLKYSHENAYINIAFRQKEQGFIFDCQNSVGKDSNPSGQKDGGIGLPNARKRLQAIYPDSHHLDILSTDQKFSVFLSLEIYEDET